MTKRIVLLQALASTPKELGLQLRDAVPSNSRQRPAPGKWSISEILNHLVDVEMRYMIRLKRVVNETQPVLPSILPDESAHELDATPTDLILRFERARDSALAFLKQVTAEDWHREALHESQGETNLFYLVQHLADHDTEHLSQMAEARRYLRQAAEAGASQTHTATTRP
jgi:uncharacterized damage-inducible protein DinB